MGRSVIVPVVFAEGVDGYYILFPCSAWEHTARMLRVREIGLRVVPGSYIREAEGPRRNFRALNVFLLRGRGASG